MNEDVIEFIHQHIDCELIIKIAYKHLQETKSNPLEYLYRLQDKETIDYLQLQEDAYEDDDSKYLEEAIELDKRNK